MANITSVTDSWQSVLLAADEIWQVHSGQVFLDTDATEANRLGIRLSPMEAVKIASGKTVYYKLAQGTGAVIARVAV